MLNSYLQLYLGGERGNGGKRGETSGAGAGADADGRMLGRRTLTSQRISYRG